MTINTPNALCTEQYSVNVLNSTEVTYWTGS